MMGEDQGSFSRRAWSTASDWARKEQFAIAFGLMTFIAGRFVSPGVITTADVIVLVALVLVCFCLLVWSSFFRSYEKDAESLKQSVPYSVILHESESGRSVFEQCGIRARAARREIMVVGPHYNSSAPISSKDHDRYLVDSIGTTVADHARIVREQGKPFVYTRVLQMPVATMNTIRRQGTGGVIQEGLIGDDATDRHLQQVLAARRASKGSVDVRIYAREFIPSFPSILIVDDNHMFFSLLTADSAMESQDAKDRARSGGEPGVGNTKPLDFHAVLEIQDRTGRVIDAFKKTILGLETNSVHINDVTSMDDRPRRQIQSL